MSENENNNAVVIYKMRYNEKTKFVPVSGGHFVDFVKTGE